jgi:5'-phosphate synthase pdxT subunit
VTSPSQVSLGLLDVTVERNAYGRQVDSHMGEEPCPELGPKPLPMVFIRAPIIRRTGPRVSVLARHRGEPVLVREGRILASTFHPELSEDERVHRYFLETVASDSKTRSRSL